MRRIIQLNLKSNLTLPFSTNSLSSQFSVVKLSSNANRFGLVAYITTAYITTAYITTAYITTTETVRSLRSDERVRRIIQLNLKSNLTLPFSTNSLSSQFSVVKLSSNDNRFGLVAYIATAYITTTETVRSLRSDERVRRIIQLNVKSNLTLLFSTNSLSSQFSVVKLSSNANRFGLVAYITTTVLSGEIIQQCHRFGIKQGNQTYEE